MQVPMREKKHDNGHRVSTGPPLRYIKAATEYFYGSPDHNFLDNWGTVFYIRSCLSLVQCLARNNFPGNLFNADRQRFKKKKQKTSTLPQKESLLSKYISSLHLFQISGLPRLFSYMISRDTEGQIFLAVRELACPAVPSMMVFPGKYLGRLGLFLVISVNTFEIFNMWLTLC